MIKTAVIGLGNFSKNIVRNLKKFGGEVELTVACDLNSKATYAVKDDFFNLTDQIDVVLAQDVDVVFVATPASTHFTIVKKCLDAGKTVWTEKPLCLNLANTQELVDTVKTEPWRLHVDNTFIYDASVNYLKQLNDLKFFGDVKIYKSERSHWGPFFPDVDVVFDLLVHDVAILRYVFKEPIRWVSATGGVQDIRVTFGYDNFNANIANSWLSHEKIRKIELVGSRNTFLQTKDSGVLSLISTETREETPINLVNNQTEPLYLEMCHFFECIKHKKETESSGAKSLKIVSILEKVQQSIGRDGEKVLVDPDVKL